MSLLWLGAQPENPAQRPAHPPLGSLGAPRRPGHREELTCQVSLLGPRAHLAAPVICQLAGLMWVHVIHLLPPMRNGTDCRAPGTFLSRADPADCFS
jgi:hypothetical protein